MKNNNQFSMLMSNSKWIKFFEVINNFIEFSPISFYIKFIESKHILQTFYSNKIDLYEKWTGDNPIAGPFPYKSIEWIIIPLQYIFKDGRLKVHLNKKSGIEDYIFVELRKKGIFPIELIKSGHLIENYNKNGKIESYTFEEIENSLKIKSVKEDLNTDKLVSWNTIVRCEYIQIKGYDHISLPLAPIPRRGPRANLLSSWHHQVKLIK